MAPGRHFFVEAATGLELVAQNAFALEDDARALWQQKRKALPAEPGPHGERIFWAKRVKKPRDWSA